MKENHHDGSCSRVYGFTWLANNVAGLGAFYAKLDLRQVIDLETCFHCEAYCPAAAIFVAPLRVPVPDDSSFKDETGWLASGQLGIYRKRVGWEKDAIPEVPSERDFITLMHEVRSRLP